MNDRELLEAAARAAGIEVRWHESWQCFVREHPFNTDNPPTFAGQRHVWLPLTDDGDALRLAVNLGLDVMTSCTRDEIQVGGAVRSTIFQPNDGDRLAATRRAIVRAAAALQDPQENRDV